MSISEIYQSIPDVDKPFIVEFNDNDETDKNKAREIWGKKCHVLTIELAISLPFDVPIVATWGDHLCYNGDYSPKEVYLTTIMFTSLEKVGNYVDIDVKVIDGYRSKWLQAENFYAHDEKFVRCGGSAWPVYVFY